MPNSWNTPKITEVKEKEVPLVQVADFALLHQVLREAPSPSEAADAERA
jgi:hypothetical protein